MDITKQRTLERQLRHAQKMQAVGQLAGGIAHDFNNMLQAAKLEIELLHMMPAATPQLLGHVKAVATVVDRAASLTRQLLVFSRLDAMRVEPIDLNAKVRELTTMLGRLLGENVSLVLDLTSDEVFVDADSSMVDQVLVNLVVNARDAMDRGTLSLATSRCGHMEPATRPAGAYVCVEVRDTGAGISSENLSRIFDPFFTTKATGTGLGLATVYGIVEHHRGWIDVESEPGLGTAFRVYLPEHERRGTAKAPAAPRTSQRGKETILLVEDDDSVRRAVALMLEGHGYAVVAVNSGALALTTWETADGKIDLVVTDLMMPGMDGRELAAALIARRPETAILMISGHTRELDPSVTASFQLLHKPFEGEALLAAVRATLDRASS